MESEERLVRGELVVWQDFVPTDLDGALELDLDASKDKGCIY